MRRWRDARVAYPRSRAGPIHDALPDNVLPLGSTGDASTFSPPEYLLDGCIPAAVAGKPFVATLPEYATPQAHTINVPKIVTPPTIGVQNPELARGRAPHRSRMGPLAQGKPRHIATRPQRQVTIVR